MVDWNGALEVAFFLAREHMELMLMLQGGWLASIYCAVASASCAHRMAVCSGAYGLLLVLESTVVSCHQ
jgi:hypothetical protein